jgi:hypothetical protein
VCGAAHLGECQPECVAACMRPRFLMAPLPPVLPEAKMCITLLLMHPHPVLRQERAGGPWAEGSDHV